MPVQKINLELSHTLPKGQKLYTINNVQYTNNPKSMYLGWTRS